MEESVGGVHGCSKNGSERCDHPRKNFSRIPRKLVGRGVEAVSEKSVGLRPRTSVPGIHATVWDPETQPVERRQVEPDRGGVEVCQLAQLQVRLGGELVGG